MDTRRLWRPLTVIFSIITLIFGCTDLAVRPAAADTTAAERRMVGYMTTAARRARRMVEQGESRDAAQLVTKIQVEIDKLTGEKPDPDLITILGPVFAQLKEIHAFLALEGIKVPPLPEFATAGEKPMPEKPGEKPAGDGVRFSTHIAPMLVAKCGRCHVDDAKGKVSMSTFAALMEGHPEAGPIIMPGNGKGSRIFEVIESGDMPRGGGKLTADEFAMLVTWIDEGAKNDTGNDTVALRRLARDATAAAVPEVTAATGKETVKFALELAPVLAERCMSCHGMNRPRGDLSVATFQRLLRGGDSGAMIAPGKPADSLLIKKLKGTAGERMPLRQPPLSDEQIAKFEKWIEEGATFDGEGADVPLARVAAVARARTLTAEELSKDRAELAVRNWRLAIPDDKPTWHDTENFLLVGNVGEGVLAEIADTAEAQAKQVLKTLGRKTDEPLLRGKLTIYVFANRFDYSEYGRMVERRPPPKAWRGHWRYDVVDPYILVVKPKGSEEYSLDTLLAQQLASTHIAGRSDGNSPRWLAEGAGRVVAERIDKQDPRIEVWNAAIPDIKALMKQPTDFMTGGLGPEDADIASYSFVKMLMSKPANFEKLITALDKGADIDKALAYAYGSTKGQIATYWYRQRN